MPKSVQLPNVPHEVLLAMSQKITFDILRSTRVLHIPEACLGCNHTMRAVPDPAFDKLCPRENILEARIYAGHWLAWQIPKLFFLDHIWEWSAFLGDS